MNINLTLIGQSITFLVFVWFCMKFVWPVLRGAMDERQKQIEEGLSAAERAGHDLELAQERATQQLKEAKEEAAAIIEQANRRGSQIVEEAKDKAREEGERLKAAAEAEIAQEVNRAKEELRGKLAGLVVSGAERILAKQVDVEAHREMVDALAAEL